MTAQDQILSFLRTTGPTIPSKVAKVIGTEIYLASAHLSDLSSQGKVKISDLKVGSSPLYFLPGQEERLYAFAAGNMNPKNLIVLDKLKDSQILREANLDLLSRVALRSLKDFAIPLNVKTSTGSELFWKWHLLSEEKTNYMISDLLNAHVKEEIVAEAPEIERPVEMEFGVVETIVEPSEVEHEIVEEVPEQALKSEPEQAQEEPQIFNEREIESDDTANKTPETIEVSTPEIEETSSIKTETEPEEETPTIHELDQQQKEDEFKEKEQDATEIMKPSKKPKQTKLAEGKKPLIKKIKEKMGKKKRSPDTFLPTIEEYFTRLDIRIDDTEVVRKNSEVNMTTRVPSVVGSMTYFCKAKSKSKCDEKDISAAYMEAQMKKLPLLFLYNKQLTKKAQEMIEGNAFENAIIKKVE
jgi:hypothetical protein